MNINECLSYPKTESFWRVFFIDDFTYHLKNNEGDIKLSLKTHIETDLKSNKAQKVSYEAFLESYPVELHIDYFQLKRRTNVFEVLDRYLNRSRSPYKNLDPLLLAIIHWKTNIAQKMSLSEPTTLPIQDPVKKLNKALKKRNINNILELDQYVLQHTPKI